MEHETAAWAEFDEQEAIRELDRQLCDFIDTYVVWHTRPSPQEAARDRLFQLSMPVWVENGRAFHE